MVKKLTSDEQLIRQKLAAVRGYPRWKWVPYTKGFIYYINSARWVQEVFKHWDGRWSTGNEHDGTFCYCKTLQAALAKAEQRAQKRVATYSNGW
jgi:hypothetical protein